MYVHVLHVNVVTTGFSSSTNLQRWPNGIRRSTLPQQHYPRNTIPKHWRLYFPPSATSSRSLQFFQSSRVLGCVHVYAAQVQGPIFLAYDPSFPGQALNCVPRCSKYSSTLVFILRLIIWLLYVDAKRGVSSPAYHKKTLTMLNLLKHNPEQLQTSTLRTQA